jgi:hypothetical protein
MHTEKITMLSSGRMDAMLHRFGWWRWSLLGLLFLVGVTGCVERRMVIIPEPLEARGAIVYDEKDQPIGAGPVDKPFTYYGKYRFRLAKDGYETLVVEQRVRAPWYELPGLDFFSENLIPWTIRDVRYFYPVMQRINPLDRPPEQLLLEAQHLQSYGKTIGAPVPPDLNPLAGAPPTVLLPPTP